MGGLETTQASVTISRGKRLEGQRDLKERQFGSRWSGRSSLNRDGIVTPDSSPTWQSRTKGGTHPRSWVQAMPELQIAKCRIGLNCKYICEEIDPACCQWECAWLIGDRRGLSDGIAGRQPVYQLRNSNSSVTQKGHMSVRTKPQQFSREVQSETERRINEQDSANSKDEDGEQVHDLFKKEFIQKLAEKAKQRRGCSLDNEDFVKSVKAQPKFFKQSQPVDLVNTFTGSPKKGSRERTSRIIPRSSTHEKVSEAPAHEKFPGTKFQWMSKCENLDLNHQMQPWSNSKVVKEVSKDFILSKFFQTPTKFAAPAYRSDIHASDEEMGPRVHSSTKHMLSSSQHHAAQTISNEVQQLFVVDEMQNLWQMIARSSKSRGVHGLDTGNILVDQSAQIRRDICMFDTSSVPLVGRFLSVESGKDSVNASARPTRRRSGAEDLQWSKDHNPNGSPSNENGMKKVIQSELPGILSNVRPSKAREDDHESQLVLTWEKENMLKSLKVAAAVDQVHFLRALQDNGAVQSSTPPYNMRLDLERPGYSDSLVPIARPSSPNVTVNNNIPREARGNYGMDAKNGDVDGSSEKSSLRRGEMQRSSNGEGFPQSGDLLRSSSASSSFRSSHRSSITSDESQRSSGGSIVQKLIRNASLRSNSSLPINETVSSSIATTPKFRSLARSRSMLSSDSKLGIRRTLSFADSSTDILKQHSESHRRSCNLTSSGDIQGRNRSSSEPKLVEDPSKLPSEKSRTGTTCSRERPVFEFDQSEAPAGTAEQHVLNNSLRIDLLSRVNYNTVTELKSCSTKSPTTSNSQNRETVLESCRPVATPVRISFTVLSGESPCSTVAANDDSGSEVSGIEQPSPVSVLSYNNGKPPFQEESRLSPLEHKLQELHERINKSKTEVSNQKKINLEKIKARTLELTGSVDTKLETQELPVIAVPKAPHDPVFLVPADLEDKKSFATVASVGKDERAGKVRPAGQLSDFCTTLDTFDIHSVASWAEEQKWDLVYVRDVLVASSFGRDKSMMTKWHSVTEPMDPRLFEDLEDFYKNGKKFPGSQFLSSLAVSQENHLRMQEHIQNVHLSPAATHRGPIDAINRRLLFDVVNETLAKKLFPYVAIPHPWMKPLAKPVVRHRPTGSGLLQEIWAEICDQIGNNGSMAMEKAQLHKSLEALIGTDLCKRSHLFPHREVEKAAERIGLQLERWIFEDLLEETILSVRNLV